MAPPTAAWYLELMSTAQDDHPATDEAEHSDIDELRVENERLRAENAELREQRRQAGRLALAGGSFAARVAAGRGLTRAVKRWLEAKTAGDPLPVDQTADVAAAIVRRVVRVGVIGLAVAALPTILLIWHGFLIRGQNELFQSQLLEQTADRHLDRIRSGAPGLRKTVLAFVEIERRRGLTPDLSGADLHGMDFIRADFSETDLRRADLGEAKLSEARLRGADLTGVHLKRADLEGADLSQADLTGASLQFVNLLGADLSEARNLTPEQFTETCGDERTKLPEGIEMPDAWPCRFELNVSLRMIPVRVPLTPEGGDGAEVSEDRP